MHDCSHWLSQSKSTAITLICSALIIALCGCTESVRKVNYITDDALQSPSPKDAVAPLQNKSAQELVIEGFIYLANQNLKIAELHFATAIDKDP